ncbi:PREDICTED: WAT1-related protein At4g01440-like [Tarenaya hassleriana]|uniref:WAT1-related protein At4g01440-like n=1 Tax=Tarenaya hassleriana TaxID=28532 RepID=UPI00053C1C5E|nr:PREDICTED: WAT1-related protein At4g01440-like [Tarenaya hassleriana]
MSYCDGKWTPVIMMIVINSAVGSVNSMVKKVLDGGINHMVIATYRLAISTVFLMPIAYLWERKTRPKLTFSILCQLFFSALLGASLTQYFFLLGLSYTSATLACAFMSMMPAVTFIMALIFRIEKLNMRSKAGLAMMVGTLACIGGALFLTMYKGVPLTGRHRNASSSLENSHRPEDHTMKPENWIVGCVLLFTGSSFFGSWMLIQAKINKKYPCQYSSTVVLSFFGTIQCALLSLTRSRDVTAWILKDKLDVITVVYAGVVGQGICTVGMSWCIKQRGPIFTSTFTPVTLIFATLFDFSILHREIYLGNVLGSAVVLFGLYVFLWGKIKQMNECATKLPCQFDEAEGEEQYKKGHPVVVPMTP